MNVDRGIRRTERRLAALPLVAAAIAVACGGAYLAVIASQGDPGLADPTVIFVASYVAAVAVTAAATASTALRPRIRFTLLASSAAGAFTLAVLGAITLVTLPLAVSGVLLTVTATDVGKILGPRRATLFAVVASVASVAILFGGLVVLG